MSSTNKVYLIYLIFLTLTVFNEVSSSQIQFRRWGPWRLSHFNQGAQRADQKELLLKAYVSKRDDNDKKNY